MIVITRLLFIVVVMYALPVQSPLIQRQQRIVVLLFKQFPCLIQRRFPAHILQTRIGPFRVRPQVGNGSIFRNSRKWTGQASFTPLSVPVSLQPSGHRGWNTHPSGYQMASSVPQAAANWTAGQLQGLVPANWTVTAVSPIRTYS